jgi:hypothetical protein
MDEFLETDASIRDISRKNFVIVRLSHRATPDLLATYPPITGAPYFYILEKDGALLHPQDTDSFESGDSYDRDKMLAFFQAWSPPSWKTDDRRKPR